LKKLALDMKEVEKEKRKPVLKEKANQLNLWFDKKRWETKFDIETDFQTRFQGLIFPMNTGDDEDPYLILKIIPELGHVFATKERAPIMLCFEVIKFKEGHDNYKLLVESSKKLHEELSGSTLDEKNIEDKERKSEEVKEGLEIDVENHLQEDGLKLEHTDPKALVHNPFTGEEDEEQYTPSPMKAKKLS